MHAPQARQLLLRCVILITVACASTSTWAARRVVKKRSAVPTQWYASADATYTNWVKDKWEGGGESRVAGLQFGLNLPWSLAAFMRVSAMPEPYGFQDIRAGVSRPVFANDALRNTLSSSFTIPTSEYSRSIDQKTQASLASTLEYFLGAATLSLTGYGAKAWYTSDGALAPAETLELRPGKKDKAGHRGRGRPPLVSTITEDSIGLGVEAAINGLDAVDTDLITMTRFDHLAGAALDLTWRFTSEWAVNSAGSITQSTFSTGESVWTADVTWLQVTYSRKLLTVYGGTGVLDSAPVLHWPEFKTYTVGVSHLLPN